MGETVGPAELGRWLRAFADAVTDNADELTALDSAIGDADHGVNMRRGMTAVIAKLDAAPDAAPAALLKTAGMTLVSTVGGASGPLYGTLFLRMGTSASDHTLEARPQGGGERRGVELGAVARRGPHPQEERAVQRPARPADRAHQGHTRGLQQRGRRGVRGGVELGDHGGHPTPHVHAVVGVADRRVERRQVVRVVRHGVRERTQPAAQLGRAHRLGHPQTPHRKAAVLIGASHRRSSSSSTFSSETEQPAMSRLVM